MDKTKLSNPNLSIVSPKMATQLTGDDKANYIRTPYHYLAESIINGSSVTDFKRLLEHYKACVLQINTYTGGAAARVVAVRQQENIELIDS